MALASNLGKAELDSFPAPRKRSDFLAASQRVPGAWEEKIPATATVNVAWWAEEGERGLAEVRTLREGWGA